MKRIHLVLYTKITTQHLYFKTTVQKYMMAAAVQDLPVSQPPLFAPNSGFTERSVKSLEEQSDGRKPQDEIVNRILIILAFVNLEEFLLQYIEETS